MLLFAAMASSPTIRLLVPYLSLEKQDYRDLRVIRATLSAVSPERPLASDQQAAALLRARLVGVGNIDKLCCGVALDLALLRVLRVRGRSEGAWVP